MRVLPLGVHTVLFGDNATTAFRERVNSDMNRSIWRDFRKDLMDAFRALEASYSHFYPHVHNFDAVL